MNIDDLHKAVCASRDRIKGGVYCPEDEAIATLFTATGRLESSLSAALAGKEKVERELTDEKQQVANLEEYMLKGVAFRDELQARINEQNNLIDALREQIKDQRESLRDKFAMAALGGILTYSRDSSKREVFPNAELAYIYADAMMERRGDGK